MQLLSVFASSDYNVAHNKVYNKSQEHQNCDQSPNKKMNVALFLCLTVFLRCAIAALFLYLVLTDQIPRRNPVPADLVLLEDDLSKQKLVAQCVWKASVRQP